VDPRAWNWRIVLVRPRNPLNIGAAARAMGNFGFRELVVVNPYEPTWQEMRSAPGAEDVVRAARAVARLVESVGDARLVLGTSSGQRRHLTRDLIPVADLPAWLETCGPRRQPPSLPKRRAAPAGSTRRTDPAGLPSLRAALLFGSEKTGLSNEEMSHCHALVRIPTSPDCPSMNLGQAVAVCCYELARHRLISTRAPAARIHRSDPANLQSLEHLLERAGRVLDEAGYLQPKTRQTTLLKLRQFLLELGLTNYDARILGGILAQIEWKIQRGEGSGARG
jgi:tRNA C32,U32 (ribose-2'-O)-methylase TrmJ